MRIGGYPIGLILQELAGGFRGGNPEYGGDIR
jgi:hypothetical protein